MSNEGIATPERPVVRVTDNDLIAAMQILACIARPHRPASGGELLQMWFWSRKHYRREKLPELGELQFLKKKWSQQNRIEPKLKTFSKDLFNAFSPSYSRAW